MLQSPSEKLVMELAHGVDKAWDEISRGVLVDERGLARNSGPMLPVDVRKTTPTYVKKQPKC